jgi:hypothetical protein
VAGRVIDPEICLDLGQAKDDIATCVGAHQQLAQKLACHDLGGTLVKIARERWRV